MNKNNKLFFSIFTYILLIIYPLLVIKVNVYTGLSDYEWYFGSNNQVDYFIKFKSYVLITVGALMFLSILYDLFKTKFVLTKIDKFVFITALSEILLLALSTIFSTNKVISVFGFYEQYENVFVLISYIILFVYYYKNRDLFREFFNSKLFCHSLFIQASIFIILSFAQGGNVYLTLYNPDYAATYLLMFIPLLFYIVCLTEIKPLKIVRILICLLSIFTLILTNALYPILLFILECILMLVYYVFNKKPALYYSFTKYLNKTRIMLFAGCMFILFLLTYSCISSSQDELYKTPIGISEINTKDDCVEVVLNDETLYFSNDINKSSKKLDYSPLTVNSERYGELDGFIITCDYEKMFFTNEFNNTYMFLTPYDKVMKLKTSERAVFTRINGINSGREYIWARTLPIIKKHLILGVGPDAFTYSFPHNDYIQAYCVDYGYQLITKPHNFYLQILVQTGLISLAILIAFIITSYKSFCKNDKLSPIFEYFIFIAITGFILSGLMNDSCIAVTPLFYILLGVQAGNQE